ncbi:MAG TPA: hypothetical protein V6D15_23355 [Oculatellaceae cyanobacterium]|jgi:hypothetical protein
MLQGIWKSLVNAFQSLFGSGTSQKPTVSLLRNEPPPALEDADYEYLFMQLIEGVAHGWQQQRLLKFFDALEHRTTQEQWFAWLRRFGDRLLTSSVPNNELAARMVQLGEIGCGEIGVMAYDIGMQLLTQQDSTDQTWDLDSPQVVYVDAEEMTFEQNLDDWNDSSPELFSAEIEQLQTPSVELDSPQVIYVDAEKTIDVEQNLDVWNDSSPEGVSSEIAQSQPPSGDLDSPQVIYVDAEKTTDVNQNLDVWNDSNPELVSPETAQSQAPSGDLDSPQVIYVNTEKTTDVEQNRDPWDDSNSELVSEETAQFQPTSVELDSPQVIYVNAEKTTDVNQNRDPWDDSTPELVSSVSEESQEFSIDELLFMLEQNPALAREMSEQLQITSTNPEAILEAFIQQLDKDMPTQADESQN